MQFALAYCIYIPLTVYMYLYLSNSVYLLASHSRLILLGASHYKPFNEFASNEAIIMTEIYEYARSLFDHKFSIVNFQHYKYLLATRILDYGQHFRCTNYLEQIAKHIELKPDSYDGDFIQRVRCL